MSLKVLIVDDSKFMRSVLLKIFEKFSKVDEITEAGDGVEAIEKYQKNTPNIVTMDLDMPKMNGIEAAKKIKSIDSNAKILMVTSSNKQEIRNEAERIGTLGYITKPFDNKKIEEIIEKI